MKLSYSSISAYQNCPLQYYFRYEECRPALPGPALSFGQSVHEALRWFYDVKTPDPYSRDELLDYLDSCWVKEGFESSEESLRYFLHAKSVLERFYRLNVEQSGEEFEIPAALEHKFRIDLGFCDLSGVIDRMDRSRAGGFEIIDYKTSRRLPPVNRLKNDLQLPIYQIASEKIWEAPVDKVTFYYLLHDHFYSRSIAEDEKQRTLDEIERVVSCIKSGEFDCRENPLCPWCDYISDCPAWEGRKVPARKTSSPSLYIGEVVDEVIRSRDQILRKTAGIEALEKIISGYFEDHGIDRVEGARGYAFIDEDGNVTCVEGETDTPA